MGYMATATIIGLTVIGGTLAILNEDKVFGVLFIVFGLAFGSYTLYGDILGNRILKDTEEYVQEVLYPNEKVTLGVTNNNPGSIYTNRFVVQSEEGVEEIEVNYVKSIGIFTHTSITLNDDELE